MSSSKYQGIVTASGREVTVYDGVPSLTDIALALSRQPRFGGHSRQWWTVLDHSLFCQELAEQHAELYQLDDKQSRALRLAALLHDAHEALTADVPTPFKSPGLAARQRLMDKRIFAAYFPGGELGFEAFASEVKEFDRRALVAEARVLGPMAFDSDEDVDRYFGLPALPEDVSLLAYLLSENELGSDPADLNKGIYSPSVSTFTTLYLTLR